MASKFKLTDHYKSKTPSPSPPTSRKSAKSLDPKREVAQDIIQPIAENLIDPEHSSLIEAPEVQYLVHKLQGILISQEEPEISQDSVTSQFTPS